MVISFFYVIRNILGSYDFCSLFDTGGYCLLFIDLFGSVFQNKISFRPKKIVPIFFFFFFFRSKISISFINAAYAEISEASYK